MSSLTLLHSCNRGGLCPTSETGLIRTIKEWEQIKQQTDLFYALNSESQIDSLNERTKRHNNDWDCFIPDFLHIHSHLEGWTYWLNSSERPGIKIGHTGKTLYSRVKQIAQKTGHDVSVLNAVQSPWHYEIEQGLHRYFHQKRIDGEWFDLNAYEASNIFDLAQCLLVEYLPMEVSNV